MPQFLLDVLRGALGSILISVAFIFISNRLGHAARDEAIPVTFAVFIVLFIDLGYLAAVYTESQSPFGLAITVNTANEIENIEVSRSPIVIALHGAQLLDNRVRYLDDENREYWVTLPNSFPVGKLEVALIPAKTVAGWKLFHGPPYWISSVGGRWIVVTGGDFIIVLTLIPITLVILYEGSRGQEVIESLSEHLDT
jgi:hypothetical protein